LRWAIVIGIDEYGGGVPTLGAAVHDAKTFRDWVTARNGGRVPRDQLRLLLGRRADDPKGDEERDVELVPTKDNIVAAINDVVNSCGDDPELLYFFFAGHGIRARVASRDEDTLLAHGFDPDHTEHSLAVRSLTEHFETTPFKDQFFFLDACRDTPWERELAIGKWPIPRRRDPGKPPVQQFILFATSPGLTAAELAWSGAFSEVLMGALEGEGSAKAWSWERNCYEVRWERLARYLNAVMSERQQATNPPPGVPIADWPVQIPQDIGIRGVEDRDRDALLVSYAHGHFPNCTLTLTLEAGPPKYRAAEVSVLDALGQPVATALEVRKNVRTFTLPPKTYAARAVTTDHREGMLTAPIDLYADADKSIPLSPRRAPPPGEVQEPIGPEDLARAGRSVPDGTIEITSRDPLAVAEICDEGGHIAAIKRPGDDPEQLAPGFYRVRRVGPEQPGNDTFVVLQAGKHERVAPRARRSPKHVVELAQALGVDPGAWAQPSTVVAAAAAEALGGRLDARRELGLDRMREGSPGVALFAVAGSGDAAALGGLGVRIWRAGDGIPRSATPLEASAAGVAAVVAKAKTPESHWLSLEPEKGDPTVLALPVLPGRLATVVAQVDADRVRMYEFHPVAGPHESSTPQRLRLVEHLQRLLLSGRLDGAAPLTREIVERAADDPFAGCLAGYVLLRLGRYAELGRLASSVVATAPSLSDAYILRGEYEARAGKQDAANQAFADAVNAGIPAFGEGLTRLVEGLRASAFVHPRGALVRHIFQRHARGSMWAAFVPRRKLEPGGLVISGADIGFEG
jgi:hypothetical protein